MRVGAPYCAFLSKHHGKIIMLWLLLVLVGAPLAQLFIGNCTNVFDAPEGSPSSIVRQKLLEADMPVVKLMTTVVLVRATGPANVTTAGLVQLEQALRRRVVGGYNASDGKGAGSIRYIGGYSAAKARPAAILRLGLCGVPS